MVKPGKTFSRTSSANSMALSTPLAVRRSNALSQHTSMQSTKSNSKLQKLQEVQFNFANLQEEDFDAFPTRLSQIIDILDLYKNQFDVFCHKVILMQQSISLKLTQTTLQLNLERNFIITFSLFSKIVNLSATFGSLIGNLFGMNVENPWHPEREGY